MLEPGSATSDAPLIVFAGGGTGGHLYPSLAIAEALRSKISSARFMFIATQRSVDQRILGQVDAEVVQQPLVALHRAPWRWVRTLTGYRQSSLLCRSMFERNRPAVIIGTGGLGSVPAMRAARRAGIPTAILNPDALPGRANRFLADSVDVVFAQWEETEAHLPRKSHVITCGCAIRAGFNQVSRDEGIKLFGLDVDRRTLLITGASQGARTINEAVIGNIDLFESLPGWQLLHLTGDADLDTVQAAYDRSNVRSRVLPFTDDMAHALAAADLVLARAGASSLAEITAVGRPAILMPYPYHKDMHQLANARCLVRASAARIMHDRIDTDINVPALREALGSLMTNDDARSAMAAAARRVGHGQASAQIATHLIELMHSKGTLADAECLETVCAGTR